MLDYNKLFLKNPFSVDQESKNRWFFKDQKNCQFITINNVKNIKKLQIKYLPN